MSVGSPRSPTVANIVMDKILNDSLNELKGKNITMKYITKYVDDVFAIVKKDDLEEIQRILNVQHQKIRFTTEIEKENSIAFLDTKIIRKNNGLIFNWFMKETASGRVLNYYSNHPIKQKLNTATNMIWKTFTLSNETFHRENTERLEEILRKNAFPDHVIKRLIRETKAKIKRSNNKTTVQETTDKRFVGVTYIPKLTITL